MPFNGAGTYSLPAGSIVSDGTTIDAADHNTPLQDVENSLSQLVLRNGAAAFTGNQSMGGNKLTNLAAGTVAADAATLAQAQSNVASAATAVGGTTNAVALTFSPPIAAYVDGMCVRWVATASNTGAMTVNCSAVGAKAFKKDASGTLANPVSGEVRSGMFMEATFSTANDCFVWTNQKPVFVDASGSVGIGGPPTANLDVYSAAASGNTPQLKIRNTSGATTGSFGPTVTLSNGVSGKHGFAITQMQDSNSPLVIANSDSPYTQYISISQAGDVLNIGPGGLGYGTGSGGSVTQTTSKSTAVTLNKTNGQITMASNNLSGGAEVLFTVYNSTVAATDIVVAHHTAGVLNNDSYRVVVVNVSPGDFRVSVTNVSGTSRSEALVINFAVIKAVTS